MIKKILGLGVALIMCLGFSGCNNSMRITDFEGLKDLPRNPVKIVYSTNLQNFDDDGVYGDLIEYEVPSGSVAEVMDNVFTISFKAMPKNIDVDMPAIERILIIYNEEKNWTVKIGLLYHNKRWYEPSQHDALIEILDSFVMSGAK